MTKHVYLVPHRKAKKAKIVESDWLKETKNAKRDREQAKLFRKWMRIL